MPRVILALLACASAARVTVPIDLGWRIAPVRASCAYATPTTCQIGGLNLQTGPTDATSCAAAACAGGFSTWQWAAGSKQCWAGNGAACAYNNSDWVGGMSPSGPPTNSTPEVQPNFDDSAWRIVDTPHDATIENAYSKSANGGEAFLPSSITWYRKHLNIPAEWEGMAVTLTLDASLSTTSLFLNGKQLVAARPAGYLPLIIRLDGAGLVVGGENVLVVYVDGTETTGWWYEGSGLIRHSRLVVTGADAYIAMDGVAAPAYVTGAYSAHGAPADGLFADGIVTPSVDVLGSDVHKTKASWRLISANATVVGTSVSSKNGTTIFGAPIYVTAAELWSIARPYLYTLETSFGADAVNTSIGIRVITFDAERGMSINEQHVKHRGFCEHESFAGVGGALPDRVDLFRVQQMRGVGGNAWRTSHNPPEPVLLDITDRLGVIVLDENRVLASQQVRQVAHATTANLDH